MERQTKQVVVIRGDIKMSCGKACSQVAHASMAALLSWGDYNQLTKLESLVQTKFFQLNLPDESPISLWLSGSFAKIVLITQSEDELITLRNQAQSLGFPCALIEDNGKTEFHGVKTKTTLAIGPWWSDEIDKITGHLELY